MGPCFTHELHRLARVLPGHRLLLRRTEQEDHLLHLLGVNRWGEAGIRAGLGVGHLRVGAAVEPALQVPAIGAPPAVAVAFADGLADQLAQALGIGERPGRLGLIGVGGREVTRPSVWLPRWVLLPVRIAKCGQERVQLRSLGGGQLVRVLLQRIGMGVHVIADLQQSLEDLFPQLLVGLAAEIDNERIPMGLAQLDRHRVGLGLRPVRAVALGLRVREGRARGHRDVPAPAIEQVAGEEPLGRLRRRLLRRALPNGVAEGLAAHDLSVDAFLQASISPEWVLHHDDQGAAHVCRGRRHARNDERHRRAETEKAGWGSLREEKERRFPHNLPPAAGLWGTGRFIRTRR